MIKKGLYETFYDKWINNGKVYLYSDPHFSDDEMKYLRKNYINDEEQIKRINKVVHKDDTIIFLGDIGNIEYIKKIKGYKVLIQGNHDSGASNYKRIVKAVLTDTEFNLDTVKVIDNHLFDEVYEGPLMISDRILLSHEPIDVPDFILNIHGHDHSNTQFKDCNHLNVCAELIDYTPVCLQDLIKQGILKEIKNIHRYTIDNI